MSATTWGALVVALVMMTGLVPGSRAGAQRAAAPAGTAAPSRFVDATTAAKIAFVHDWGATPNKRILETLGSGVAWLDYDNDGFEDLFFVNGAPGSASALYHNNHDGTFSNVTAQAGVGGMTPKTSGVYRYGVAVGDFDNNGFLDLYVTAFGANTLLRNNGNGTFSDVSAAAGVAGPSSDWSTSAGFVDIDRDGDLDLYVANYLTFRTADDPFCGLHKEGYRMYCGPTIFDGQADRLYRNNGNGTFTDISRAAGIANPAGKGLGVAFCDVDGDANVDIYVANDQVRNFLYRNNGDGTFKDIAYGAGVGFSTDGKPQGSMGVDCADIDGNGLPDIFVTNFEDELNSVYRNLGGGAFQDVSASIGLRTGFGPVGFGAKLFDMDNDGDLDLVITNGHVIDNVPLYRPASTFAQRNLLYENVGGRFLDVSDRSGPPFTARHVGRGLAVADFDNDGDLDVVISNQGEAPILLKNQSAATNHWITLRARGTKSNRFGLGTHVEVEAGGKRQVADVNNAASYLSGNDIRIHVGVGAAIVIDRITLRWPSGRAQTLTNIKPNQILTVDEP
ncbi:MAG: CRTAC1 family protein [Vicinamibacterales bacterium]